jgi:hypothetical protein
MCITLLLQQISVHRIENSYSTSLQMAKRFEEHARTVLGYLGTTTVPEKSNLVDAFLLPPHATKYPNIPILFSHGSEG